jgi:PST family polysaccharide transporter
VSSLTGKAARGAIWTILSSIGGRAIGVVGTLIITRYLDPDAIGDVGTAMILVMTVGWLSSIGFNQYVIVRARGEHATEVIWHASTTSLTLAALGFGTLALVTGLFGDHLGAPEITQYIPILTIAIAARRLSAIPEKILVQRMQFRAIAIASTLGEAIYAGTTIFFAARGHGAWSVAYGNVAQYSVMTLIILANVGVKPWTTPTPWSWSRVRDMMRFGGPLLVEGVLNMGSRYWDAVMIRWLFGAHPTGLYRLAYSLADIPAVHVGEQVGMVLLPSLAGMEPERRPRAFERATALLSLIIFPLAVGLGVVADTLIAVIMSPEWQEVAPFLTVLAALSVVRPIGWVVSSYLQAQERNKPLMYLEMLKIVTLLGGMLALSPFGAHAAAGAVGAAFAINAVLGVWLVLQNGPRPRVLIEGFLRPLFAAGAMAAAVLAVRFGLQELGVEQVGMLLVAEIVVGAIVYVGVALVVCRDTARDLLSVVRQVRSRRSGADAPS